MSAGQRLAMKLRFRIVAILLILPLVLGGCSLYRRYRETRPATIQQTEALLEQAGFQQLQVETPSQRQIASTLPTYEIRFYPAPQGTVYWYYDPDGCRCVYVGNADQYQQYVWEIQQQNDIAEYQAQPSDQDVAALNLLNPGFFPPILIAGGAIGIAGVSGSGSHAGGAGGSGGSTGKTPGGTGSPPSPGRVGGGGFPRVFGSGSRGGGFHSGHR